MPKQLTSSLCFLALIMTMTGSVAAFAQTQIPVHVFVSVLPQKYVVQKIGGDLVTVQVMVPPGAGPATYEPKPGQMAALSKASIYFSIGVPFEKVWLPRIAAANRKMTIVAGDQGITKIPMTSDHDHNHGKSDPQGQADDPHIWLSPPRIKIMADTVRMALTSAAPDHAKTFEQNYETFCLAMDDLNEQIQETMTGLKDRKFIVFHPSWGYFAETYGLTQIPIEAAGKTPKPAHLSQLIRTAKKEHIRVVFVQPQFSTRSADVIAKAIDGRVVVADPLALDLSENLLGQARAFKAALSGEETK